MGGSHSFFLTYAVIESWVTQISQMTQILTYSVFEFRRFREILLMTCRILAFFLVVSKKKGIFAIQ